MSKLIRTYGAAAFCAVAVLVCALLSRPFTTMNVCDDGPYIRMAETFARTGHIVYNGWAAAMMVSQIYLAQPFIKLFGYSYTTVRMSTLLIALLTAFLFQRVLVHTGASSRNATMGTLAAVISPMYLMLAVTFMSDMHGLFAIMLCLYGCVRALRTSQDRAAIGWIVFAVITCAIFGTSRQIAWLGDLVMVPSALWLMRSRRNVLLAGGAATAVSFAFVLACMHWLGRQPYVLPVPLIVRVGAWNAIREISYTVLEIPFLLLPLAALFGPRIFRSRPYIRFPLLAALVAYMLIAWATSNAFLHFEPTAGYAGGWVNVHGVYTSLPGAPIFLHFKAVVILTIVCIGGLLGIIAVVLQPSGADRSPSSSSESLSWKQLGILLLPFSLAYLALLAAATGTTQYIYDRYTLGLLGPAAIVLVRLYQERVQRDLPPATVALILLMGAYGVIATHNTFAMDRARVKLADEIHASGVPFTSIDGAWEYNFDTELDNSNHINSPLIKVPANGYVAPPPVPPGYCPAMWYEKTPHIHAVYALSFDPTLCYGVAPFTPVQYRPWPLRKPVNLYAVRYAPPDQSPLVNKTYAQTTQ